MIEHKGVIAVSQPRWIPVTERLPEENVGKNRKMIRCIITDGKRVFTGSRELLTYKRDIPVWKWNRYSNITHWMPLPKPPKEEAHES